MAAAWFREIFDHHDDDKNEVLDWDEFKAAVMKKFPDTTDEQMNVRKEKFDEIAGDDGHLTWEKVEAYLKEHHS